VPSYRVALTSSAAQELQKLASQIVARIFPHIESLASNPRPSGCKKMQGGDREYRIRIGNYRVVYTIDDKNLLVEVTRIRHRKDVYER
jgi:mRNA interferase RelE/StbE